MGIPLISSRLSGRTGAPSSMGSPLPLKIRPSISLATGRVRTFPRKVILVSLMSIPSVPSNTWTRALSEVISRTLPRLVSPEESLISTSSSNLTLRVFSTMRRGPESSVIVPYCLGSIVFTSNGDYAVNLRPHDVVKVVDL